MGMKLRFIKDIKKSGNSCQPYEGERLYVDTGSVQNNKIIDGEMVSFEKKPSRANICTSIGDVLFAKMKDSVKVIQIDSDNQDYIYSTGFYCFRDERIEPSYLKYLFMSPLFNCIKDGKSHGSTMSAINDDNMKRLIVDIPDLPDQKKVVERLDRTASIIECVNKQIDLYNELVSARFYSLFEEPKALKNYQQLPLDRICEKIYRYPGFYGMEYLDDGVRVIRIGNILKDGHMQLGKKNYVYVYDQANIDFPETVIEMNDIVMAVRGDGSCAKRLGIITDEELVGSNISPNLIRIKPNPEYVNPLFLYHYLTGDLGQVRLDAYVKKTAKKNIKAEDIKKVMCPVPSIDIQNRFVDFVKDVENVTDTLRKRHDLYKELLDKQLDKCFFLEVL